MNVAKLIAGLPVWMTRVISVIPAVFTVSLLLLWQRATVLLGYTPRYMQDDPKFIAPHDLLYNGLYNTCLTSCFLTGVSLLLWPCLMFGLRSRLSRVDRWLLPILFAGSWVIFLTSRNLPVEWLMD